MLLAAAVAQEKKEIGKEEGTLSGRMLPESRVPTCFVAMRALCVEGMPCTGLEKEGVCSVEKFVAEVKSTDPWLTGLGIPGRLFRVRSAWRRFRYSSWWMRLVEVYRFPHY